MSFKPMGSSRQRMGRSVWGQGDSKKFSACWSAVRCNKYHQQLCTDKPSCQGLQLRQNRDSTMFLIQHTLNFCKSIVGCPVPLLMYPGHTAVLPDPSVSANQDLVQNWDPDLPLTRGKKSFQIKKILTQFWPGNFPEFPQDLFLPCLLLCGNQSLRRWGPHSQGWGKWSFNSKEGRTQRTIGKPWWIHANQRLPRTLRLRWLIQGSQNYP